MLSKSIIQLESLAVNKFGHAINFVLTIMNNYHWICSGDDIDFSLLQLLFKSWPFPHTYVDLVISWSLMAFHVDDFLPSPFYHHLELYITLDSVSFILRSLPFSLLLLFFHFLSSLLSIISQPMSDLRRSKILTAESRFLLRFLLDSFCHLA